MTNPLNRAEYFGVLFDEAPTYTELNSGIPNLDSFIKLNEVFIANQGMLAGEHREYSNLLVAKY